MSLSHFSCNLCLGPLAVMLYRSFCSLIEYSSSFALSEYSSSFYCPPAGGVHAATEPLLAAVSLPTQLPCLRSRRGRSRRPRRGRAPTPPYFYAAAYRVLEIQPTGPGSAQYRRSTMFDVHLGVFDTKAIDAEERYDQLFFLHPPQLRDHINDAWKKKPIAVASATASATASLHGLKNPRRYRAPERPLGDLARGGVAW